MSRNLSKSISTNRAPTALGPYSQAVVRGGFVFVSGQLGLDSVSGELCDSSTAKQAEKALDNIEAILHEAGTDSSTLVKLTLYLVNLEDFEQVNQIMSTRFAEPYPARACVEISALPKGAKIEIDAIACM